MGRCGLSSTRSRNECYIVLPLVIFDPCWVGVGNMMVLRVIYYGVFYVLCGAKLRRDTSTYVLTYLVHAEGWLGVNKTRSSAKPVRPTASGCCGPTWAMRCPSSAEIKEKEEGEDVYWGGKVMRGTYNNTKRKKRGV